MNDTAQIPPRTDARHSKEGWLALVPTPIGNMGDITLNALDILRECDAILCEDTRVTKKLLAHYQISKPLYTLHDHNEKHKSERFLEEVLAGRKYALVSDAGTPIISDPGYHLAQIAFDKDVKVRSLPGANAALTALTLSGLPPFPSTLLGFCPRTSSERKTLFSKLHSLENQGWSSTYIWYESPHRLRETLHDLAEIFGADRQAVVVRELTKTYEEILRRPLSALCDHFDETDPRGEITLLLSPGTGEEMNEADLENRLREAMKTHSLKQAVALTAGALGLSKRDVYQKALELK